MLLLRLVRTLTCSYAATPEFENKGVGALRRSEDGSIDMEDPNTVKGERRAVRVKVIQGGVLTGHARPSGNRAETPMLKDKIETARDFVYEEELFYEIMREARHFASQGITTSEDAVTIDLKAGTYIQIDMVCGLFYQRDIDHKILIITVLMLS